MSKEVEKQVAEQLAQFYKKNEKLYKNQMGAKKNRSAINATIILVLKVQNIWIDWQIARFLLIDVKKILDHVL